MFRFLTIVTAKSLLAGCLLATTTLFANPVAPAKPASFDASLYVTKANKIRLAVEKTTTEPVTINLCQLGKSNVSVFTQQIGRRQTKVALQIDVSQLPDGAYELEIKSATGRIVKQINLATSAPQTDLVRTILMP